MRKFAFVVAASLLSTPAMSDADPRYLDPEVVVAELRLLVETCRTIPDQAVQQEIFGLTIRRDGDTCFLGRGEVDENVARFFQENPLNWAGLDGDDGLWVRMSR